MRSALEYAYVLRKSNTRSDFNPLKKHVERQLINVESSVALPMLIQPLDEVINMPIHTANHWLAALSVLDSIEARVLH